MAAALLPLPASAEEATTPGPQYTYIGAGYEWSDSHCAVEPGDEDLTGITAEGSVGIFDWLHLVGTWYDGETDSSNLDIKCYTLGAGLSYRFAPGADIVLRGSWAKIESDDADGDADGFEPELLLRFAASDRAEVTVGMAYYDMEDDANEEFNNTEVRVGIAYRVLPWLAVSASGTVFDEDTAINAGVRAYFGSNLF